ncbi:MAG: sulfate adenylyltransferase [Alteromonadaceae bacterium]|nr:MAG: sulfate adenylyltransferase [Alteromonadaceae bacterium]
MSYVLWCSAGAFLLCFCCRPLNALEIDEGVLEKVAAHYGGEAVERVRNWGSLMVSDSQNAAFGDPERMKSANDFFNLVAWLSDQEHWGREDYWATPIEMLATNGGDCEDFSIGKYFTLRETKLSPDKLRITYVKSLTYNTPHMVLAYYETPDAEPLILDNINKQILPASQRQDLLPVYSFNGESIWLAKARGKKLKANSQSAIPQWQKLNSRMLSEFGSKL